MHLHKQEACLVWRMWLKLLKVLMRWSDWDEGWLSGHIATILRGSWDSYGSWFAIQILADSLDSMGIAHTHITETNSPTIEALDIAIHASHHGFSSVFARHSLECMTG